MNLKLVRAGVEDAKHLWEMQFEAFMELYNKYHDTETSPATEQIDKIIMRLEQSFIKCIFFSDFCMVLHFQRNEKSKIR